MAVSYQHARQFCGQSVCIQCEDGSKHYGIVREVTRDGIWMDIRPRGTLVGDKLNDLKVTTADKPSAKKLETVFFSPFFFPFFSIFAITPFFFI